MFIKDYLLYNSKLFSGGAIFLEDGAEIGDVLDGNLAIYVRTNSSLLNEDVTPAAFWVNNPYNVVINNAVAGGTHFGYWYRMLQTPDGPSFATYPNYCPYRPPFGRFFNNTLVDVHGVGRFGVWIFPEYSPAVVGSCWNDASYQAIQIRNAIIFDNDDAGLRCVTAIDHQETNLPNLRRTFYNENIGSSIINSTVIGDSGPGRTLRRPDTTVNGRIRQRLLPLYNVSDLIWDRGLRVRNVSFINFPDSNTQAIFEPFIIGRCVIYCGAHRGRFRWSYDGLYQDEDGLLSSVLGGIVLPPDGLWNSSNACTITPNFINAIACPSSLGVDYGLEPGDYLIILYMIDCKPDIVYTISSAAAVSQSARPLSGSTSQNGDWYYNTTTSIFSYIVKNPSTSSTSIDGSISLNLIKY
ncbi:unnamed protein product [Rotaria magnacalcarata]|uniref:CEMIP beta-helix domain-containing protein n=1 Tax=Rotaria magnacalcarata TaxID=392030 RepID=A0A816SJ37_9BILA|nr:unnamed protein product [Rotaria magnacalcarata]